MVKQNFKLYAMYAPIPMIVTVFVLVQTLAVTSPALGGFDITRLSLLIAFSHVIAVGDFLKKSVPNRSLLAMLSAWAFVTAANFFADVPYTLRYLASAGLGLLAGGGLFLLVYVISRRGLGGGDVKFMAVAGLYLTGYRALPAMLAGTILAGLTSLALLALRRVTRKDSVPLIPFLYGGILVTLFLSR
jgi:Flp pilus assembly protein protease CpaA